MENKIEPTLYIIMRSDIPDLNPGKMAAQAAHAQADFDQWGKTLERDSEQYSALLGEIEEWKDGRSFGRTLVLSATGASITHLVATTDFSGLTVDPTYPWRNYYGELFLSNELTCAWAFLCNENPLDEEKLKAFPLHR